MNKPISEDLIEIHQQCLDFLRHPGVAYTKPIEWCVKFIERIGRVEQERDQLCATRIEDGLTIARLQQENDKLKLFVDAACDLLGTPDHKIAALRCIIEENDVLKVREGELNSQVVRLIADKQDLIEENAKLKAQVKRLSAPVNMQDQSDFANRLSDGDEDHPCDRLFDATDVNDLIAARLSGKESASYIGHLDCDGNLVGEAHSSKCIAARLAGKEESHG